MTIYDERPWLARYRPGTPLRAATAPGDALTMFRSSLARDPERVLVRYFDGALTVRAVDQMSDALGAGLLDGGFRRGDRLAVYLQNTPHFVVAALAAWKAGGIVVPVNPMNKERELRTLLEDSGATALVCHPGLYDAHAARAVEGTAVRTVVTAPETDFQTRDDPRVLAGAPRAVPPGTWGFAEVVERYRGCVPPPVPLRAGDVALLSYTSGTTGPPKGAMNTHGNVVFSSQVFRDWIGLTSDDVILGVAPLFHITGMIGHLALALLLPAPLVLTYRFQPEVVVDAVAETRATYTIGAITVFIALLNTPGASRAALASLRHVYSGGAPIPPSRVEEFSARFGSYIHNIYGLTETTAPSHAVPLGAAAPVDPVSGALSVGVPVFDTVVRIVGDDGRDLPVGEVGELVTEGPQVVAGYWCQPEETERALGGGRLRTGDVGFMDADGWFYLVDRKKDQINASGFKVWPREVEDVLAQHPAVREAGVVGVPDAYRGETVKAVVSLRPGCDVDPAELIAFCRDRLAAYKYPRLVHIVDELPKTMTGKILRRALRDA